MHGSMVEDFVAVVRGGSSKSITALVSRKLPTPELMGLWGEGIRFNPDFIRTTVSFSSFIIQLSTGNNDLIDAQTFTKELVSDSTRIGTLTERQSTATLINSKLNNKQQKMPNSICAKCKEAALLQHVTFPNFGGFPVGCVSKPLFKRI